MMKITNSILDEGNFPCTGCSACKISCSFNAITMEINSNGFISPVIDSKKCTSCGVCKTVCYKYTSNNANETPLKDSKVYAMWSRDEKIRFNSATGGVGSELISYALGEGYKVIGCTYDNKTNTAKHIQITKDDEREKLVGSKYIMSFFDNAFEDINFKDKYLVIGLPCQIHGLRKIIKNKRAENNFILVDLFCHGVPSYRLWFKYLSELSEKGIEKVDKLTFRLKKPTWHDYSVRIDGKNKSYQKRKDEDLFMRGFLSDLCLNESCYSCQLRKTIISSDIRIGDFWGDEYKLDRLGVNIVTGNTDIGIKVIEQIKSKVVYEEKNYLSLEKSQLSKKSAIKMQDSLQFNKDLQDNKELRQIINRYVPISLKRKVKIFIKKVIVR